MRPPPHFAGRGHNSAAAADLQCGRLLLSGMLGSIAEHIQVNGGKIMDIITSALTGALGNVGGQAVQDAYAGLKALLLRKFGKDSALVKSVEDMEQNPDSAARKAVLAEEMEKSGAHEDAELRQAAKALQQVLVKQQVDARGAQIGIMGDNAHVEGGIHFGGKE
jgi:hypothetical protein